MESDQISTRDWKPVMTGPLTDSVHQLHQQQAATKTGSYTDAQNAIKSPHRPFVPLQMEVSCSHCSPAAVAALAAALAACRD